MKRAKIVGAVLSLTILTGMLFIPESIGLSRQGINTLGVLTAVIVALVTEPLPIGVTCMLGIPLCVIFGVTENVTQALSGYTNHIIFFVLVSFGISEAIAKVPLSQRMLILLIKIFGTKIKNILLALMFCAAIISSIMSNLATTVIFISVVINFLNVYTDEEERRRSGKAFMIGLPLSSMIGGMITPAGSPLNILGMDFINSAGIRISFVQWIVIGAPVAVIMLLFAWFIIGKTFKPAEVEKEKIEAYLQSLNVPKHFDAREKSVAIIVLAMLTLWILSSWVPVLNITVVGTAGFALFFLPGINVLDWKNYTRSVSWASFFLVGTMMSLGNALVVNGVSDWLVKTVFPATMNYPLFIIVFFISIIVFVLLLPIPIGPALISMLGAPFIGLARNFGISPALLLLPLVLCASNCYLLPLDTVPLLTYATGYYKMSDMPKVSFFIQLLLAALIAAWVPGALGMLGVLGEVW